MKNTLSPNGYSDYKRKTIDDHEEHDEEVTTPQNSSRFESYL